MVERLVLEAGRLRGCGKAGWLRDRLLFCGRLSVRGFVGARERGSGWQGKELPISSGEALMYSAPALRPALYAPVDLVPTLYVAPSWTLLV